MARKLIIDIARKPITFQQCDRRRVVFAPSWELLREYQGGGIDWEEYTRRYYEEMRAAYREDPEPFRELARQLDEIELACWCTAKRKQDQRCHRFLLRKILEKVRQKL